MDQQRVNGAIDEVVGSARRHIGNLTGDTETQVGGVFQQFKGKVETAVGKVKDAAPATRMTTPSPSSRPMQNLNMWTAQSSSPGIATSCNTQRRQAGLGAPAPRSLNPMAIASHVRVGTVGKVGLHAPVIE